MCLSYVRPESVAYCREHQESMGNLQACSFSIQESAEFGGKGVDGLTISHLKAPKHPRV